MTALYILAAAPVLFVIHCILQLGGHCSDLEAAEMDRSEWGGQ